MRRGRSCRIPTLEYSEEVRARATVCTVPREAMRSPLRTPVGHCVQLLSDRFPNRPADLLRPSEPLGLRSGLQYPACRWIKGASR